MLQMKILSEHYWYLDSVNKEEGSPSFFWHKKYMNNILNKLKELCEISRLRYELFAIWLPSGILGRCDYQSNIIFINSPKIHEAIMTMAHEMGHYASFLNNMDMDFDEDKRETLAYLYGWGILRYVGADVNKEEWKKFHYI